jgi:uncharacterized membrane protein YuzA (DUF378 family)
MQKLWKTLNKYLSMLDKPLIIAGCLNWGMVGLFGIDVLNAIFYTNPTFLNSLYLAVGFVGIKHLIAFYKEIRFKMDK